MSGASEGSPYRAPKAKVPRLDRSFTRAWKAFHVFAVFASLSGCGMSMLDYAAHVDGPGVGLYVGESGHSTGFLAWVFAVALALAIVCQNRLHWTRAWALGTGLWILSLVGGLPTAVLHWSWEHACRSGSGRACYANAGAHRDDVDRSNALYKRACELGDGNGCEHAIERKLISCGVACEKIRAIAAGSDENASWAHYGVSRCDADGGFDPKLCPR